MLLLQCRLFQGGLYPLRHAAVAVKVIQGQRQRILNQLTAQTSQVPLPRASWLTAYASKSISMRNG